MCEVLRRLGLLDCLLWFPQSADGAALSMSRDRLSPFPVDVILGVQLGAQIQGQALPTTGLTPPPCTRAEE